MSSIKSKVYSALTHNFSKKFYSYLVIGLLGVVVDTIITNIVYNLIFINIFNPTSDLNVSILKTISVLIGGFAGIINNFILNDIFVYKIKGSKLDIAKRFSKYILTVVFVGWFLGKIIVFNIASALGLGLTTSNIIAIAAGTFVNYPINYFWTWRSNRNI